MSDYEKLISIFENNRNVLVVNQSKNYFEVLMHHSITTIVFKFDKDGKLVDMYS